MGPTRSILSMLARVSPPQMLVIILTLSAGATVYVGHEFQKTADKPARVVTSPVTKTMILVCKHDIASGSVLADNDLELKEVEVSELPMDSLSSSAEVIGRPSKFDLAAGSPLCMRDIAAYPGTVGFQSKLHPGERAITLAVDSNSGVAGFVMPDSHVDVMVQVGSGAGTKTRAILSDVRVVASGTTYKKQPGETTPQPTSNVTVAVSPVEAGKLINAMSAGRIYLTLRSDRDRTPVTVSDVNSLFAKPAQPQIATAIQPPELPPPPEMIKEGSPPVINPPVATSVPPHEIDQWQGDKRDVTTVRPVQ